MIVHHKIAEKWDTIKNQLEIFDTPNFSDQQKQKLLLNIHHLHSETSGLKCWFGWKISDSLETIRRSMGGLAY